MRFRVPFDESAQFESSLSSAVDTGSDTPTVQSAAESCDVNVLMRRFLRTGEMPVGAAKAVFADFSDPVTYHEALERVRRARESFEALPATCRREFENDPERLLAVVSAAEGGDADAKSILASAGLLRDPEPIEAPSGAGDAPAPVVPAAGSSNP